MKKWLFLIAGLVCGVVYGLDKQVLNVTDFSGGLNSYFSSLVIADNEVQTALNVYFDKDYSLTKRNGFNLYGSSGSHTFNGSWNYTDPSNNRWLVVRTQSYILASQGDGLFSTIIATVPADTTSRVSAVSAQGNIYFVDNVQGVYYWNGSSTSYVSGSPKGTIIAEFHGRLWIGGLDYPNQNYFYGSEYLNGNNWTTGTLATDPVLFQIGLNDRSDGLTSFYSGYNDVLYLFKRRSIYGFYGFDQTDFDIKTLNTEAGCIDQGSLQPYKGNLVFASERGIEEFNGYQTYRISDKIRNLLDPATVVNFTRRLWTQDSDSDFGSGTVDTMLYMDTATVPGSLQMTFPDHFSSYRDGTLGTKKVWTTYVSGSAVGSVTSSASQLLIASNGGSLGEVNTYAAIDHIGLSTVSVTINSMTTDAGHLSDFYLSVNHEIITGGNPSSFADISLDFESLTSGKANLAQVLNAPGTVDTTQFNFPLIVQFYHNSVAGYQVTINGTIVVSGSPTLLSPTGTPRYVYLGYQKGSAGSGSVYLDNFSIYPATMTYSSQVKYLGTATSFGTFDANYSLDGSTLPFSVCTSSSVDMSPEVCANQNVSQTVAVATNSYAVVKASFSITNSTQQPRLDDFTLHWNLGGFRSPMSSVVFDERYWLSLSTSAVETFNQALIVMSKPYGKQIFTLFDIHAGTLINYGGYLYHGDSLASGNFYLDNQGFSDNNLAINSYIKTKDFSPSALYVDKFFDGFYLYADNIGNYDLNASYFTDRGSTEYSFGSIRQNESGGYFNLKLPFSPDSANQLHARSISFKLGNSTLGQPFNIYGGSLIYRPRKEMGEVGE